MKRPFFSLVTPVYNIERLLSKTIDSALSQTFTDWEMILIDDGSPDKAGEICDKYVKQDSRIKVIHKKNEGLAAARNDGIKSAIGKYFIILEGSDVFPNSETLQTIYEDLENKDFDIYFGLLQDVLEKGNEIINVQAKYCVSGEFTGGKDLFIKLFDNADVLALSSPVNKVFNTDFVKNNDLWFYKGIYHDDDEWLPRTISLSNKCYFTDKIIYNAMTWDGCFGQNFSEKSVTKKSCDKIFIANHCIKDIDERFSNLDEFKRKYYDYYIRIFLSGIGGVKLLKEKESKDKVYQAIKDNKAVFTKMKYGLTSKLKFLGFFYKFIPIKLVVKLIVKKY